jgi:quinol monooxygenase YgiN
MSALVVTGSLLAKPGKEADLEQALREAVEPSQREDGCLVYALHRAVEEPGRYTIVEMWKSKDAFDAHTASPHLGTLGPKLGDLLAAPPEIRVLEPVPVGDGTKGTLGPAA